jgi:hypothetical protein
MGGLRFDERRPTPFKIDGRPQPLFQASQERLGQHAESVAELGSVEGRDLMAEGQTREAASESFEFPVACGCHDLWHRNVANEL